MTIAANDGSFTVNLSRALAVFEEKRVRQSILPSAIIIPITVITGTQLNRMHT